MGRKHWEKEKLLITSNFSFSHIVFKRIVMQTHKNQNRGLFGKGSIWTSIKCFQVQRSHNMYFDFASFKEDLELKSDYFLLALHIAFLSSHNSNTHAFENAVEKDGNAENCQMLSIFLFRVLQYRCF